MSFYINSNPNSFDNFGYYFSYEEPEQSAEDTSTPVPLPQQIKEIRQTTEKGPIFMIPGNWRDRMYRDAGDRYAPFHILINTPKTEEISVDSLKVVPKEIAKTITLAAQPLPVEQDEAIESNKAPASSPKEELSFLVLLWAFFLDLLGYGELNTLT